MGQAAARQKEILRRSEELISTYPSLWRGLIRKWSAQDDEPRAWLMYSASYLVRTGDVRWAVDPVRLQHRLPVAASVEYAADLRPLSIVLLTHQHGDHFDAALIRSLRHLPITWVLPEVLLSRIVEAGVPKDQVVVPCPLQPIEFRGLRIIAFAGMHWDQAADDRQHTARGVPAAGYLAEHNGKRWLFPGDTRTYLASGLPRLGRVDILFAHVWLGRGSALQRDPPLLESFCRWCLDLSPGRVVLAHLEEFGRGPNDYWSMAHAVRVAARLRKLRNAIDVVPRIMGQSISL